MNEYAARRFINAFYNFYFILEDLYGSGKTKNYDILKVLRSSDEFKESLNWIFKTQLNDDRHKTNLYNFCNEEGITYNINGLIELLVKVRGNLHHYSSRSTKHIGTPFNQDDFESIAFMTMGLSVKAILNKILKINIKIAKDKDK